MTPLESTPYSITLEVINPGFGSITLHLCYTIPMCSLCMDGSHRLQLHQYPLKISLYPYIYIYIYNVLLSSFLDVSKLSYWAENI